MGRARHRLQHVRDRAHVVHQARSALPVAHLKHPQSISASGAAAAAARTGTKHPCPHQARPPQDSAAAVRPGTKSAGRVEGRHMGCWGGQSGPVVQPGTRQRSLPDAVPGCGTQCHGHGDASTAARSTPCLHFLLACRGSDPGKALMRYQASAHNYDAMPLRVVRSAGRLETKNRTTRSLRRCSCMACQVILAPPSAALLSAHSYMHGWLHTHFPGALM